MVMNVDFFFKIYTNANAAPRVEVTIEEVIL